MTAPSLRVLYVTTTTYVVRYVLIHDVRGLRGRTDATIVCANGSDIRGLRREGLRIIPIPIRRKLSPVTDVIAIWRVWRLLRRERFDLLHSYVPKGGFVGQLAAFLARALGLTNDAGGNRFSDDDSSIFELDIDRIGAAGISKGCNPPTNDRFCPDSNVTRGQMAAFLNRALG
ncbi:MAG: hypothetical protein IID05_11070 [Gemmatimonadetes bacterium]|nr:hypothetical protein [Gemmatimonadota bacterium]